MQCQRSDDVSDVVRPPDEDILEIWDKLSDDQRLWYRDFVRGTKYGDKKALERIFVNIPEDVQFRIMTELYYEWRSRERNTYTLPKSRFPKHNEFDYGWAQTPLLTPREQIRQDYNGDASKKKRVRNERKSRIRSK
jgi:hypothetical protein